MGLIKAIKGSIGGALADTWKEVLEPIDMSEGIVYSQAKLVRENSDRNANTKRTPDLISDGSVVHVYENQMFMLIDGGKIVDYTAEPGYFKVDNASAPSIFNGDLKASIVETFERFKHGGMPSSKQLGVYINTQEMKGIKFGTATPVNYFDNFYNAELFLRAFGNYSIKIVDPILFYKEAIAKDAIAINIEDINEQYRSEFLEALQSSINKMSTDGIRISHVASKGMELSKYMANVLDDSWREMRGMEVQAVGIASISYDDTSKELINMRNKGAMLGDANVREGYVQGSIARGIEAAGSNEAGSAQTFMGMGMGMNAAGGFMGQASSNNQAQMQREAQQNQQQESSANSWICPNCSASNQGKFCQECGEKKPENRGAFCTECGNPVDPSAKFCPNCGTKRG